VGDEGIHELARRAGHLVYRAAESRFIGFGRAGEAAQLPNELESRCTDFFVRGRGMEVMQRFDVSTHVLSLLRLSQRPSGTRKADDRKCRGRHSRLNDQAMLLIEREPVNQRARP
jgi:hypothetical protein